MSSLSTGIIPLQNLSVSLIEERLGTKVSLERNGLDPQYDNHGKPVFNAAGKQICLPYKHAVTYVAWALQQAGLDLNDIKSANDVPADLLKTLPFSQPTDVILFSSDGYLVTALRGNSNPNAVGIALTAAAGFPKVYGDSPEDSEKCGVRELFEETGLRWSEIEADAEQLPVITSRPIRAYGVETENGKTIPGRCFTAASTIALHSWKNLSELTQSITLNHEHAGIVALPIDGFANLALDGSPDQEVGVQFFASRYYSLLDAPLSRISPRLMDLRYALLDSEKPTARAEYRFPLSSFVPVMAKADDFQDSGSMENLLKTTWAAMKMGFIPVRPGVEINPAGIVTQGRLLKIYANPEASPG